MNGEMASSVSDEVDDRIFCRNMKQEKLPHGVTRVELVNLESPLKFSVLNKKHKSVFLDIRQCLNALYGGISINKDVSYIPMEDELVVVFFSLAQCWCRGKVEEVHSDYTATVRYVDYGNYERVPFYKLRKADEVLQHFNMQAIDLKLANAVMAKELTESENWRLKQIMPRRKDYKVTDKFGRNQKLARLHVIIEDCATRTDIRSKLLELGFIKPYKETVQTESVGDSAASSDADESFRCRGAIGTVGRMVQTLSEKFQDGNEKALIRATSRVKDRYDKRDGDSKKLPGRFSGLKLNDGQNEDCSSIGDSTGRVARSGLNYNHNQKEEMPSRQQERWMHRSKELTAKESFEMLHRLSSPSVSSYHSSSSERTVRTKKSDENTSALKNIHPGMDLQVRVTYVGEVYLYVHDLSQSGPLKRLTRNMNDHYVSMSPLKLRPPVNSLVAVNQRKGQFLKPNYNRANVQSWSADSDRTVTVFFLDFGDTLMVPLTDVFDLDPAFQMYEFQAIPVQLHGLKLDQEWPLSAREHLVKLVNKKVLQAKVTDLFYDKAILDIILHGKNLADFLVRMGMERSGPCQQTEQSTVPHHHWQKVTSKAKPELPLSRIGLTGIPQVVVLHAQSVNNFWVIPQSRIQDFCGLGERLKARYSVGNKPRAPLHEGALVVNFCTEYEEYYRAVVLEMRGQEALVQNVDWGLEEVVALSNLYAVDEEFADIPVFAVNCSFGVSEVPGKTVDLSRFEMLQKNWILRILQETDDCYVIDLLDQDEVSLKEQLIKEGEVKGQRGPQSFRQSGGQSLVQGFQHLLPKQPLAGASLHPGVDVERKLPPRYLPSVMNKQVPVVVVESRSYDEIYLHVIEETSQKLANELTKKLEEVYKDKKRPRMIVAPGDFIVVQYGPEDINYRAIVCERLKNKFRVQFVDFGSDAVVDVDSMAPLTQELREFPRLAVKCKLHGVECSNKMKWPSQIVSQASYAVLHQKIGDLVTIDLLMCDGTSVQSKLIEMEVLKPVALQMDRCTENASCNNAPTRATGNLHSYDDLPPLTARPGMDCVITFVESPCRFFIQIHDEDNWHVEQVTTFMQRFYVKKASQLSKQISNEDLQPNGLVAARFPVDDKCYRAKLVGKVSYEEWCVFFIDFGDTEVVNVSNLFPLADVFLNIPPLAMMVTKFIGVDCKRIATDDLCDFLLKELTLEAVKRLEDNTYAVSLTLENGCDLGKLLCTAE